MQSTRTKLRAFLISFILTASSGIAATAGADFAEDLARVDDAIRNNPSRVLQRARVACLERRKFALELYQSGHEARANRSLRRCFRLLEIPETAPAPKLVAPPTPEDLQAKATLELEEALALTPDPTRGLEIYRECAACHRAEGWGLKNGSVPQIAGQHRRVVIKQLADIRAGNRDTVLMVPYSSPESIGGAQAVADVASYVDTLEINIATGKGPGENLALGERLYREKCSRCHGATGEGDAEKFIPRIQSQHFNYLVRQFDWIREGKRRNADPEMAALIQAFGKDERDAVLDYVSRLEPPAALQAPPDWKNPDFAE